LTEAPPPGKLWAWQTVQRIYGCETASGVLQPRDHRRRARRRALPEVTGYLDHETRWIESFGGHHHYHRPLSWYAERLTDHSLAITGLHEPPSLPQAETPETEWTDYQKWFSTIPTMLAVSSARQKELDVPLVP
jgi:hypothetical protein